jgi:hypothetical protein
VQSAVNSVTALALTLVYFDLRLRAEPEPAAPIAVDAASEGW